MKWLWDYPLDEGKYMPIELVPLMLSLCEPDEREAYQIATSDEAFQGWIDKNWERYGTKAFVRSSTYQIADWRYSVNGLDIEVMRGSKPRMAHRSPGFAYRLAQRYLHRVRFVGLTRNDIDEISELLAPRIAALGWKIDSFELFKFLGGPRVGNFFRDPETGAPSVFITRVQIIHRKRKNSAPYYISGDSISSEEYFTLMEEQKRDKGTVSAAMKVAQEVEKQIEAEKEFEERESKHRLVAEDARRKARLASREKEISRQIAVEMCDELGWMPKIRETAKSLAKMED